MLSKYVIMSVQAEMLNVHVVEPWRPLTKFTLVKTWSLIELLTGWPDSQAVLDEISYFKF